MEKEKIIQLVLVGVLIFLIGFILINVLFLINQKNIPEAVQKMVVSEAEFSQKIIHEEKYEEFVYGVKSCGSSKYVDGREVYPWEYNPRDLD